MLRRSCTWLTRSVSNVSRPATGPRRDERRAQQVWPCLYRACAHARGPATARLSFSEDEASMCIHMIKARGVAPARHSWSRARRRVACAELSARYYTASRRVICTTYNIFMRYIGTFQLVL